VEGAFAGLDYGADFDMNYMAVRVMGFIKWGIFLQDELVCLFEDVFGFSFAFLSLQMDKSMRRETCPTKRGSRRRMYSGLCTYGRSCDGRIFPGGWWDNGWGRWCLGLRWR
jgi:hypothetical protein